MAQSNQLKKEQDHQLRREKATLIRRIENLLEGPMVFLGFVWLSLLVIDLIWGLSRTLALMSTGIWVIFIVDFVLKFFLVSEKKAFLKRNWLTAISLIVPALRIVRILRVVQFARGFNLVKVVASINRSMGSLSATIKRRGLKYVLLLTLVVIFAGSAGMYAFEKEVNGFASYWSAVYWTAMLLTSIGSEYWPKTGAGQALCFLIAVYGFCVFGYITATIATIFIDRDADDNKAPLASTNDIKALQREITKLTAAINELKATNR
jgi:voltage-gated potassium channel